MGRKRDEDEDESQDDDVPAAPRSKDEDDDDENTIALDEAKEEEDEDEEDDDDEEEEFIGESVEVIERRRLFQTEAEDVLENMTLAEVVEVLKENDLDAKLAPKLKKLLTDVVHEGEATDMDEAWTEALERLEEGL